MVSPFSVVQTLVSLGADVNRAKNDGTTPVHLAALQGHAAVVRTLAKELGADITQADENGRTPVEAPFNNKHHEIVSWLKKGLARRRKVTERNKAGLAKVTQKDLIIAATAGDLT
jgi:ankyrin repeat protein